METNISLQIFVLKQKLMAVLVCQQNQYLLLVVSIANNFYGPEQIF